MTIQQLRYIVEVSKCSTISKAAENLYMTQPALSKAIKALEDEFEIVILERSSSKIVLTRQGKEFVAYAKQVLESIDQMEQTFASKEKKQHRFTISTQHFAFTIKAFISLVNELGEENYNFSFRECITDDIIEDVASGVSDVGVLFITPSSEKYLLKTLKEKKMEFHKLIEIQPHVFLGKNHPLAKEEIIYPEQLADYPLIAFGMGSNSVSFSKESKTFSSAKQKITLYDRSVAPHLIAKTNGYNIGTGCIIDDMPGDNMVSVPLGGTKEVMNVGWVCSKDSEPTAITTRFFEIVNEVLDKMKK